MGFIQKLSGAAGRMSRMLRLTGAAKGLASLEEASFRSAQMRCLSCQDTEACEKFLAEAAPGSPPPAYCKNKELIERLSAISHVRAETPIA
jgi:hypothetical protein